MDRLTLQRQRIAQVATDLQAIRTLVSELGANTELHVNQESEFWLRALESHVADASKHVTFLAKEALPKKAAA